MVEQPSITDELAPFTSVLGDPFVYDLTRRTLLWARHHRVFEGDRAGNGVRLVVVASVYAKLCAPTIATVRQYDVAARFTMLFFYVDDAPASEVPELVAIPEPWSVGRITQPLRAWLDQFHELEACTRQLRENLVRSYHDYLRARRDELANKTQTMSIDEHWAFRRKTIFMDPYIDHWMISMGIDTTTFSFDAFAETRRLATDIVLLSNDLGSVERDVDGGESPDDLNLVDTYAREHAWSRSETVERLIELHNQMVDQVRTTLASVTLAAGTPHAVAYGDLLSGITDGNLATVRALKFRYPGIAATLRRLHTVC